MKKNFLLLFLMALLPLAGWADISIITWPTLDDGGVEYDGNAKQVIKTAGAATGSVIPTIYYAVTTTTSAPAADADVWTTDITDARVKATNAGTYYAWIKVVAGEETMAPTSISGSYVINKVDPTIVSEVTFVTGTLTYNGKQQEIVSEAATTNDGTIQYGLAEAGPFTTGFPTAKDADTYYIYYSITGDSNHNNKVIKSTNSKEIGKKAFNTTGDFTVTRSKTSANYNGEAQACPYVITYVEGGVNEVLTLTDDYTVSYDSDNTSVGEHDVTITAAANCNFSGTLTKENLNTIGGSTDATLGVWTINKKPITVRALAQSKTYDGTNAVSSTEEGVGYEIIGVVGEEVVGTPTLTVNGGDECKNAGEYDIVPSGCSGDNIGNYDINYVKATFTVNQKSGLTITAADASKKKGDVEPSPLTTITVAGNVDVSEEVDAIKAACTVVRGTGETVGTYTITLTVDEEADAIKNYSDITTNNGTFTIKGGKVLITVEPKSKTYGDSDPKWTYIVSNNDGNALKKEPTLTRVSGEHKGTYEISASGAEAPEGYEGVEYVEAYLTINAKVITNLTINEQQLAASDAIKQNSETYVAWTSSDVLGDDDLGITIEENVDATDDEAPSTAGAVGIWNKGLKVTAFTNTDYDINGATFYGRLIRNAAAAVVLDDTDDLSELTAQTGVQVTFTTRELKKGVWTTMVLPFEATVREISNALGYAVVDMLEQSGDDMNFKIVMGTVPAYTPFLVKTDENVNMNTVVFNGVDIVAAIEENLTQSNNSYNFIGKLDNEAINEDFWAAGSKMTETNFEFDKYASGKSLKALRAYITAKPGVSAAPRIFVEEPNGNVTAITCINADGEAVPAEGWYTLGGVKLQGAPTQKGVYINNGKKVVIK